MQMSSLSSFAIFFKYPVNNLIATNCGIVFYRAAISFRLEDGKLRTLIRISLIDFRYHT